MLKWLEWELRSYVRRVWSRWTVNFRSCALCCVVHCGEVDRFVERKSKWASRCRRSENRSTSRGQAKNFRICLMTTKVVSSTKPQARSVKVHSLTLLTLSCHKGSPKRQRGLALPCHQRKKKKLKATKGPAQSAFEPTTIRGSKVSRPGYIGIDDCVVKKNPWNHGHRQGVLDSRSGKSVWCAFDKTWRNPNLVCFACQITCAATDVGHCAPEPTRTPQKTQKATPSRSPA